MKPNVEAPAKTIVITLLRIELTSRRLVIGYSLIHCTVGTFTNVGEDAS
ncbi:hypothetical protein RSSM_00563 [Rhodopirellula sallentina SM41]|uniref:Uncharacterized protein n=1 Tax=Rhodopirellula sallentina SM41 TaxID=1263870 RepID=M5U9Q5_9BACT|nr:hypothetical protein RSSM_00563 [Rhodopirellula sallentina SM41]